MEEYLACIGMKSRNVVIYMECDGKASWVRSLGEVCSTQSAGQCVDWLTKPPSGEKAPSIDWIIAVFPSTNKNDGRPYPGIKSWGKPLKALKYLVMKRFNLKWKLLFCT